MERGAITDKLGGRAGFGVKVRFKSSLHMDWSNRERHAQGRYVPLVLSFVLFAWPLVGCSASCVYRMLRCVVCCCCCYSVLCVALRCVMLRCPALLLAPWLAKMHSALQLCYHRARRRFNASNCRMCMRRPQTKVLGVQVGATRTRDKEKERIESVCVWTSEASRFAAKGKPSWC